MRRISFGPKPGDDPNYTPTRPVNPPLVERPVSGSLYRASYGMHLFEDTVARRVGDILTIVLLEKTDAKKNADTDIGKKSKTTAALTAASIGMSGLELNTPVSADARGHPWTGPSAAPARARRATA